MILAGDYNVMPTELDVYKPERLGERRAVPRRGQRRLSSSAWTGGRMPSGSFIRRTRLHFLGLLRNAFVRDAGLRIDHFLLSPDVAKRLSAAGVDKHVRGWEHTSDHAPAWIELFRWS